VVFLDGGYFLYPPPAGGDQADFATRLKKPVMMVNGRLIPSSPWTRLRILYSKCSALHPPTNATWNLTLRTMSPSVGPNLFKMSSRGWTNI
jgi:hypothetical protein